MNWVLYIFCTAAAFFFMELAAWATHKYLMHGCLWCLHKDHHNGGYHPFQKNDAFFLVFAVPCWLCIMLGWMHAVWWVVSAGIGIFLYGVCYFIVHDVIIHRRFKWFGKSGNRYIRSVRRAHAAHHRSRDKSASEGFGLLIVPKKYRTNLAR